MLVRLDLLRGKLTGPVLFSGRTHDRCAAQQLDTSSLGRLPAGSLHLADLGFFDLGRLEEWSEQHVFWLTRLLTSTAVYTSEGARLQLGDGRVACHSAFASAGGVGDRCAVGNE